MGYTPAEVESVCGKLAAFDAGRADGLAGLNQCSDNEWYAYGYAGGVREFRRRGGSAFDQQGWHARRYVSPNDERGSDHGRVC